MGILNDLFRTYGAEYLERYGESMPDVHHKVIDAIIQCRTETYGCVIYQCDDCGEVHRLPRSCGNRHCPGCQHHKGQQWLDKQMERQVPGHHFLLTFTVPEPIRPFIRRFLQHVLPTGFMKVRYYGVLSPTCSVPLEEVRTRSEMAYGFAVHTPEPAIEPLPPMTCRYCGGTLRYWLSILPYQDRTRWASAARVFWRIVLPGEQ